MLCRLPLQNPFYSANKYLWSTHKVPGVPSGDRARGSICSTPVLQEEEPSVDSASEADRRHRCRVRRTCREEQVTRAAGSGEGIWRKCGIRVGP